MTESQTEILLIEDNPYEAELAIRGLQAENLANHLVHIEDGAEALDFIFARGKFADQAFMPKLILLDLKLPKVTGLEILKQLRSSRMKTVPVVIFTSSKEEQDILDSYKLGTNSYIVKPIQFEDFLKCMSDLGKYWLSLNQPPIVN